jgi:catechol 2,3-dioxygenase-like lactoylglutathione lyase family enzyme
VQIRLAAITVQDQERALRFYTEVLGFEKKHDIPMGEFRWLTVTAPEGAAGVELVLEPLSPSRPPASAGPRSAGRAPPRRWPGS